MFGFGKKNNGVNGSIATIEAPDMSKVAPGSPEEAKMYETWKNGKAVVEAAQRGAELDALKTAGGELGIVTPSDSRLIHSGEVPAVTAEQPQLPPLSEESRE